MNVNLLITENNFAGTRETSLLRSKPDTSNKGLKFSLTSDDKHSKVNIHEEPKSDNTHNEVQNRKESVNECPQDFAQSINKKTKSENTCKTGNKTKSKEQMPASGTIKQTNKQQNLIKNWLAEHFIAVEQCKEDADTKIEPKVGKQLVQIVANAKTGKSSTVTGHAVKSAEIKLLHTTEKGQLGLKTVLPATSEGQNGLKAVLPATTKSTPEGKKQPEAGNNTDKIPVLTKTITEAKSVIEKENTKELLPEVPNNPGKSTNGSSIKPAVENINLTTVRAKSSETQPQPDEIDSEKSAATTHTHAKATASQTLSNLSNPNGKEAIHSSNDIPENQNIQKLKIVSTQVSTGQAKNQGTSTSNKNTPQGFEQVLSHNTAQTLITEQPVAAAKNATNATSTNAPVQTSSHEFSQDTGNQILESIHRSISQHGMDRQVTVRLNPPELGKVSITFRQQDAELTGLMEVNKAQTRFEIEQTLPQIIRNLADSGIQIKRLEVMLSNEEQSGQGAPGNQSLQSGGAHQQHSSNPGTPGNEQNTNQSNDWLAGNNSYENLAELQEALITDSSINMLI